MPVNLGSGQIETRNLVVSRWYHDYRNELYHYALRFVKSTDLAEDAIHQAFTATIVALDRGVTITAELYWLRRCVRNACIDILRARRNNISIEALEDVPELVDIDTRVTANMQMQKLRQTIKELPDPLRVALVLSESNLLTYSEVARQMERSIPAVRQLVYRARLHLRAQMST